jgi:hypothetical protein
VTDAMMPSRPVSVAQEARSGPSITSNSSAGALPRCPTGRTSYLAPMIARISSAVTMSSRVQVWSASSGMCSMNRSR